MRTVLSPNAPRALALSPSRLMRISVCVRPFRAAGPRLEEETVDGKRVIHNYGHGGAGWSLAWGSADEVLERVRRRRERPRAAVIGAGAIGLTTATRLAEAGIASKIYAREFPAESRSARATGSWSPDSRIALKKEVNHGFAERWERWTRASYATHQHFVGLDGHPVEFTPRYLLWDRTDPAPNGGVHGFLHLGARVADLIPAGEAIEPAAYGFASSHARMFTLMTFNVAQYADALTGRFLRHGGRMERRTFGSFGEILALPEEVIVHCTGYGAKDLLDDRSLVPVRGQIAWLAPQDGIHYGVYYKGGTALARRDGIAIRDRGENDDFGYGIEDESPDQREFERILAALQSGFARG